MASSSPIYQWHTVIHYTSDSIRLNTLPLPIDSRHFDIHTHYNFLLRSSSNQFFPLSAYDSQSRLSRDLLASSDESIRASAIRTALIASMPLGIEPSFIDGFVPAISPDVFDDLVNQRRLSMGLLINVIYHESTFERVYIESMEDNNNNLGFKPASKSCIDGLKRVRVEDDDELNSMEDNCIICLEKHSVGDEVIWLPCEHVFHGDCILEWLQTSHLCPLCRFSMSSADGRD